MKFEINSSDITFSGKGFKSFFKTINEACIEFNISYFVVGAFARDIILENIFNQPAGIATQDIDVAIRIDSWENFTKLIDYLKNNHGFVDGSKVHEYMSPGGICTDILPFGTIENNRTISFPPHFDREINMLGFDEIHDSTLLISIDHEVELNIASIEGIALLKFIAWKDREPESVSEKHTRDIGLIIASYFDGMVSEFASEFSDLFDDEDNFDLNVCASRAIGRRLKQLSTTSPILEKQLDKLFSYIIVEEDNSLFLTQLANSSNWDYPFCLRIINSLIQGFREY